MKKLAVVILLLCVAAQANAQFNTSHSAKQTVSPAQGPVVKYYSAPFGKQDGYRIPGERMKRTGSTLTILGGAMFIGGIAMVSNGGTTYDPYTGVETADGQTILGAYMIVGGLGMAIPGIIFWSKGAKKYNRYMEQQKSASFRLGGNSAALVYRF